MNELEHPPPSYRFEDTSDPNWKDLVFVVEEGQVLQFNVSGGVSTNTGAFGIITYSQRNFDITNLPRSLGSLIGDVAGRRAFHGAGQELRLRASPGTEISFYDVYLSEPDLLNRHRDRISGSILARRNRRMYRSHDEDRNQIGFTLGRQVGADSGVFAGYTWGSVEISNLDRGGEPSLGSALTVPRFLKDQEGESDLAYVEFGYRMATLDSRLSPRNGVSFSWTNQLYDEGLGGDYDFHKSEVRFDFYDEFDEESEDVSDRYHLGLDAGVAYPYGDTDNVPYSERYHLGGQSRMRGWRYRGVGPNELDYPIGGETYLYGTIDYRRPLVTSTQRGTYREIEMIHGGFFVDVGVLDPDAFHVDLNETRLSAGIIFGITRPLPIVFSFGFPLREGDGDRTQVFAFNISYN